MNSYREVASGGPFRETTPWRPLAGEAPHGRGPLRGGFLPPSYVGTARFPPLGGPSLRSAHPRVGALLRCKHLR